VGCRLDLRRSGLIVGPEELLGRVEEQDQLVDPPGLREGGVDVPETEDAIPDQLVVLDTEELT